MDLYFNLDYQNTKSRISKILACHLKPKILTFAIMQVEIFATSPKNFTILRDIVNENLRKAKAPTLTITVKFCAISWAACGEKVRVKR